MPKLKFRFKCSGCERINYLSAKNPKNVPDKIELKKYCRWCKKSVVHRETKVKT